MRIDTSELFDIVGYVLGKQAKEKIEKHYKKYGDWGRVKQIIIGSIVAMNSEKERDRKEIERLRVNRQLSITDALARTVNNTKGKT